MTNFWDLLNKVLENPEKWENIIIILGLLILSATGIMKFTDADKAMLIATSVVSGLIGYMRGVSTTRQ